MSGTASHHTDTASTTTVPPWDGALYAANTAHHRAFDADFLASLPLAPTDRVLDVGCGSGDLTATIAGLVPDGHVVGVDAQPSMLDEARRRARPNQSFVLSTAQALGDHVEPQSFDVVTSRAVLHWVPAGEWPGVLATIADALRPGGTLRIECGGGDNIPQVLPVLDEESTRRGGPTRPGNFLPAGAALILLEGGGFEPVFVRTVAQRRPFDETTLVGWLRSQCFQAYEVALPTDRHADFRAAVEARLDDLRRADGTLDQTFVRLDLLANRPG
jgi:trans-aconitate methyltransferase